MNIYISTADKSIHIIEAFQYLYNKYWGDLPVTVLGYKEPGFALAPNFSFVSLGKDKGPRICGELLDYFSGIEDEHFVWSVDDQVIIRPFDHAIWDVLTVALQDDVGRASLVGNVAEHSPPDYTPLSTHDGFRLIEQGQGDVYRLSAVWSIWRREYFLKYLKPGMDLWQWETMEHAKHDNWSLLATDGKYAVTSAHVYARGRLYPGSFRSWDKFAAVMSMDDQEVVRRIAGQAAWAPAGQVATR